MTNIIPPYSNPIKADPLAVSKELSDTKESLRAVTQKFAAARKERDQLKTENKELQGEVMSL